MKVVIKKDTILCAQSQYHLQQKDILIVNGIIEKIAANIPVDKKLKVIEGKNLHASIGWMDVFADFADPGFEYKEDLNSGMQVAAAGGYTDVMLMPNTQPTISSKGQVEYIINQTKNKAVQVHVIGAISKNCEGTTLAEMYDMQASGAIAFSDGKKSIQQSGLLLKALQYVKSFNGTIIQQPIDESLTQHGLMNEGVISTQLGMQGKIDVAEYLMIHRDIELLRYTESKLHITGVSTAKGIDLIRKAKKEKLNIIDTVNLTNTSNNDLTTSNENKATTEVSDISDDVSVMSEFVIDEPDNKPTFSVATPSQEKPKPTRGRKKKN